MKFTEKAIAKLPAPDPSGRQRLHWSDEMKGFGVLCSGVSRSKTYIVQRALPGGKSRRVTVGPVGVLKLAEAEVRAKEVLAAFYKGMDPKAGRLGDHTLRSAMEEYLKVRNLSPRTVDDYRGTVAKGHLAIWADTPLKLITRDMVEDRLKKIAKEVSREFEGSNGHAAANGAMRILRLTYNFAADRAPAANPMPSNPVKLKKVWFDVPRRTRSVRATELSKFYASASGLPNQVARDYILLLLFTGMRRRECAALKWDHVDFKEKVIRLPSAITKTKKALDLPMSDIVHDLLVARRAIGDAHWVFPAASRSGHIEEPKFFFNQIGEDCGLFVSPHDLRRTFITVAESCDISPSALKALVNHSLGGDITEGYMQMEAERLREPAQRVAEKLKKLCAIPPLKGENVRKLKK